MPSSDSLSPMLDSCSTTLAELNSSASRLIYAPCQDGFTRVVTLHKGELNEPIICTLAPIMVHGETEYEALSYVWGSQAQPAKISLDGQNLFITNNLEVVLKHLRKVDSDRVLWIDALCINQSDTMERNRQVQQMHHIYANASRVLAWLGPRSDSQLPRLLKEAASDHFIGWLRVHLNDEDFSESLVDVLYLFIKDYWERVWTIQELAHAKDAVVLFGSFDIPYATFIKCARCLLGLCHMMRSTDRDQTYVLVNGILLQSVPSSNTTLNLERVLLMLTLRKSSDPRDRVYALNSLFDPFIQARIVINYSKTVKEVFVDTARGIVEATGRLDLITWSFPRTESDRSFFEKSGISSWIPLWGLYGEWSPHVHESSPDDSIRFHRVLEQGNVLHAKGRHIGVIQQVVGLDVNQKRKSRDSKNRDFLWSDYLPHFRDCHEIAGQYGVTDAELFFKTCVDPHCQDRSSRAIGPVIRDLLEYQLRNSETEIPEDLDYFAGRLVKHQPRMNSFLVVRRNITPHVWTNSNDEPATWTIAVGDTFARHGDSICALGGHKGPVILRSRGSQYEIVGPITYMDGEMENESLRGIAVDDLEDFFIC